MMNTTTIFKLDGKDIEAKDLQPNDVLNIAYDTTGSFRESSFYDVIVTRNVVDGVKCTSRNDSKGEYTIGGTKYKAAEGMVSMLKHQQNIAYTLITSAESLRLTKLSIKELRRIEEHLQEGRRRLHGSNHYIRKVLKKSTK